MSARIDLRTILFLTAVVIIGAFIISLILTARRPPTTLVTAQTIESHSDLFFTSTITRYPALAEIIEDTPGKNITIGVNANTDQIAFGTILGKGGTGKRQINLTAKGGPSRIHVVAYGQIAPYLNLSNTSFILTDKESIYVTLNTIDATHGNYSGEVDVIATRSRSSWLRAFLGY